MRQNFAANKDLSHRQHVVEPRQSTSSRQAGQVPKASGNIDASPRSAYIHLPFCKKKCHYCDFPVIAVGSNIEGKDVVQERMLSYVDALCREIVATRRLNVGQPLKTLFFGGGTPSLISLKLLERLIKTIEERFGLASDCEISIEADPGTFDAGTLRSYKDLGVTRVSVGVQAFDDHLLKTCGRAHDLADAYRAIEAVHASDMPTWSLDLMCGLPQLTEDCWESSLMNALDAEAPHISVYDLQLEEGTPFGRLYKPGVAPLPSDKAACQMYRAASLILRSSGFQHYEVSNYCLPGHRCEHNMTYWKCRPYYAFGMGSASYLCGRRFSRPKRLQGYLQWLEIFEEEAQRLRENDRRGLEERGSGGALVKSEARAATKSFSLGRGQQKDSEGMEEVGFGAETEVDGAVAGAHMPVETEEDRLTDYIMLGLRLSDGIDLEYIANNFNKGNLIVDAIVRALESHMEMGTAELQRKQDGTDEESVVDTDQRSLATQACVAKLTDPDGFLISNDVISDIFLALEELEKG